jgi:ABC-type amino acid transport substrate-binding protein
MDSMRVATSRARCAGSAAVTIAVLALLLHAAPVAGQDEKVVVVADHDWAPFLFAGKKDAPKGIVKELMELCLPSTGFRAEFKHYPINRMFAYLEEGRIDVNVMSFGEDREAYVVYGREPIFTSSYRPFVLAHRDIEVGSMSDLDPLRLGHLAGLHVSPEYQEYLESRRRRGGLTTTTTQESLIRMLLAERIDVFVLPLESLAWRLKEMDLEDRLKVLDLDLRSSPYYVTVSKASPRISRAREFLDAMDRCITESKRTGAHSEVLEGYGVRSVVGTGAGQPGDGE